ncbi:Pol protein [Phytophthora palmivora]|uniref:Pol protein n=1 Tax=Phytophthora palmivora TaxID=4796 RepID=A0A2P4YF16_9STRA|nr:Pol protein [Phytophthora palmivora]
MGVAYTNGNAATGQETTTDCQAYEIAITASPNDESRRGVWASTVAVLDGTDQASIIDPQAAGATEKSAEDVCSVGNIVPRKVEETEKMNEIAMCVSSVGNRVPRGVKKTSTRAEVSLSTSRVDNKTPHSESETPPAWPVEEQYHTFDSVSGRQVKAGAVQLEALPDVSALLNLEELSMKDFLAELKAGEIAEMVLLKPEISPEGLNSSSVMYEDVLEGFTLQRATRMGSEILKNPEDPVYPLVQWPLPREQCEIIDAFFAEKAKSGMAEQCDGTGTDADLRKDVLLNNMSGCTLYSALDLVDGYYQILMRESAIPLTAVSTPSGMLCRAEDGQTAMDVHLKHLRRVFDVMGASKRYASIDKEGQRDCGMAALKDLRKRLGLANYLHNYSTGYAELARSLSDRLKKDAGWIWE